MREVADRMQTKFTKQIHQPKCLLLRIKVESDRWVEELSLGRNRISIKYRKVSLSRINIIKNSTIRCHERVNRQHTNPLFYTN